MMTFSNDKFPFMLIVNWLNHALISFMWVCHPYKVK